MHRQPRQPARRAARGEGRAVVTAHRARQTELAQGLVDNRLHRRDRLADNAALDQKASVGVGDGQQITTRAVGGAKPTLKIDAPEIVRLRNREKGLGHRHRAPPPAPRRAQSLAAQQIADGRRRRPLPLRIATLQHRAQLLRSPIRPLAPQRHNRLGDLFGHRQTMPVRRPRARRQPVESFALIALDQPVPGVPSDAIPRAQHRHRQLSPQPVTNECHLLVQHTGFLPRHRQSPPLPSRKPVRHPSGLSCPTSIRFRPSAPLTLPSPRPAQGCPGQICGSDQARKSAE